MTIEKLMSSDISQLQIIGRETFYETFSEHNSEENMRNYLKDGFSDEKLSTELANENSEFYFAKIEEKMVGYMKLNFGTAQTEQVDENAMEIAQKKHVTFIWLGVWEENPRAIQFYKKNGFVEFDKHFFTLGDDQQVDLLMRREL